LTNIDRVATEIKTVGLYDLLYQDIQSRLQNKSPTVDEIKELLKSEPEFLEEYKQTNLEYNLSNIHLKPIDLTSLKEHCREFTKTFNEKLEELLKLEKYTLKFENSSVLVLIFSVEFFVLFSVQYFIVLLSLKKYQLLIYAIFLASVGVAWWYAKREKLKFEKNSKKFYTLYDEALEILNSLEERRCIKKDELWVMESEEHI